MVISRWNWRRCGENTEQHRQLVNDYATRAKIYPAQLWRQVRRWFPWLLMLKAGVV